MTQAQFVAMFQARFKGGPVAALGESDYDLMCRAGTWGVCLCVVSFSLVLVSVLVSAAVIGIYCCVHAGLGQ